MLFLNEPVQSGGDPGMPVRRDVATWAHWNLWQTRQMPYQAVEDRTEIVLVSSWRGAGRLTWVIRARNVIKQEYGSKRSAVSVIAGHLRMDRTEVRDHRYTLKGAASGYLLAFRYEPVRKLPLPRPATCRSRTTAGAGSRTKTCSRSGALWDRVQPAVARRRSLPSRPSVRAD